MSRVVTPPPARPATPASKVPQEKIAQRAYEKWVKRGQRHGSDIQDWLEAEAELRAEMSRPSTTTSGAPRR
jgi:hypothetical protein